MLAAPFFRRNLPHWQPLGVPFFLTYRLAGTLPREVINALEQERQRLQALPMEHGYSEEGWNIHIDKKLFALWDEYLDKDTDIQWLAEPQVATIVRDNLYYHARKKYCLWAYVIMPNHVHILLQPDEAREKQFETGGNSTTCCQLVESKACCQLVESKACCQLVESKTHRRLIQSERSRYKRAPLSAILHSLRSYTANQANKILNRTGAFWKSEVYDHWVRDNDEFQRIIYYIENNPVKAGLAREPDDWRFSSAYDRVQNGLGPFAKLA